MNRLIRNAFRMSWTRTPQTALGSGSTLEIDGVPVQVKRKAVRHLRVVIRGRDAAVRVSAPLGLGDARIRAFLEERREWIHRQRRRIAERNASRPIEVPRRWISGETLTTFGEARTLDCRSQPGARAGVTVDGGRIVVITPPDTCAESRRDLVAAWLRADLAARLPEMLAQWEPMIGVSIAEIRLRQMRTRWGTCNIRARRIWLSTALAEHPPEIIEYVLVHELVHLHERLHNARFHALMDRFLPDWRKRKSALDAAAPSAFLAPLIDGDEPAPSGTPLA